MATECIYMYLRNTRQHGAFQPRMSVATDIVMALVKHSTEREKTMNDDLAEIRDRHDNLEGRVTVLEVTVER
jgi:hypothetical protein